jgi:hypothetical protein
MRKMIELAQTPKKIIAELGLGDPVQITELTNRVTLYEYSKNGVIYEIEQHKGGAFDIALVQPISSILREAILEIAPYTNIDLGKFEHYCEGGYEYESRICVSINQRG